MDRSLLNLLAIGAGGFVGAILRFLIDPGTVYVTGVPVAWQTFIVNIGGSFAIGVLFVLLTERAALPSWLRGPLMIGLVGSFTTFSTVALAGWQMIEQGAWLAAMANLGGSIVVGMVAVIAGVIVGRLL
jgi:fluoride exporter